MRKLLVCGTRSKVSYAERVFSFLDAEKNSLYDREVLLEIIEGCCPDSADQYAEQWAKKNGVPIQHFPSHSGNYLQRNIEMVKVCNEVLAFWDGFSYGTAHTIATAILWDKPVHIVQLVKGAKK